MPILKIGSVKFVVENGVVKSNYVKIALIKSV